jgi:DNA-binding CsgD family transcriptional regulator
MVEICKPLVNLDIDFFVYVKLWKDNRAIVLTTNSIWLEHYLSNLYNLKYLKNFIFESTIIQPQLVSTEIYPENEAFKYAYNTFNYRYGLVVPFANNDSKEVCYFATKNQSPIMYNNFMGNLDLLTQFKFYFKERAEKLLKKLERNKLPSMSNHLISTIENDNSKLQLLPNEIKDQILNIIQANRYYLKLDPNEMYLTKMEYNVVLWLIKGKAADEIGIILGISRRTVEGHILKIKDKFDCNKTTQLIYKLIKFGLEVT